MKTHPTSISLEIKVFQYAPYDKRLLDEGNNFHLSSALRTFQGINIPDLLQKHDPQLSSPSCLAISPVVDNLLRALF
jgi:hypothetical protein